MSTTYDDLVSNIKTYSGRTDSGTLNNIPQFIAAAQSKLDATLRIAEMIATQVFPAAGTTTPPITMLETESVVIGDIEGSLSTLKEVLYARKFASPDDLPVCRHNYTMNGNVLELVTPREVTITGYQKPPRISTSLQTNAYTQGAENALLWLSLGYLSMFVQDTDTAKSWSAMAENEIDSLNEAHSAYQMIGTVEAQKHEYF